MSKLIMMVGLPGCGKTTLKEELQEAYENQEILSCVYSTDIVIEHIAALEGLTYNEQFSKGTLKTAKRFAEKCLSHGLSIQSDIIWDQTNLTKKSRASKLKKIPSDYRKIAVYFEPDLTKVFEVNKQREAKGRDVPKNVLMNMIATIEAPTESEGFDRVVVIRSWEELNALSKENLVNL